MKENQKSKDIVVFYHGNCPDGFGGAYSAWKKLKDKADYIPLLWENLQAPKIKASLVYFIDFSPEVLIKKYKAEGRKIILIDHHITARDFMHLGAESLFDIERSGATLAWTYFHPNKKLPRMIAHIQDQDTWQFRLKGTKEVSKIIGMEDLDFKKWDKLCADFDNAQKYRKILEIGSYVLRSNDSQIKRIIGEGVREARFEGKKAYVVNSPFHESVIGNELAKNGGLGIIWSERRDGAIKISLRSKGPLDVSKIAQKYGGGGHKNAAGFTIASFAQIPWKYK